MNTLENSDEHFVPTLLLRVEEAALRLGIGRTSMYRLVMTARSSPSRSADCDGSPPPASSEYIDRLRHQPADPGA